MFLEAIKDNNAARGRAHTKHQALTFMGTHNAAQGKKKEEPTPGKIEKNYPCPPNNVGQDNG
jgi:hypothetical protein